MDYAKERGIIWREDSTNTEQDTPRNYIRAELQGDIRRKQELYKQLQRNDAYRKERESELEPIKQALTERREDGIVIDRSRLLAIDNRDSRDVLFDLLRSGFPLEVDREKVLRLEHFAKTALPGKRMPLNKYVWVYAKPETVELQSLG